MRMLNRGKIGCQKCTRIPVPNEEDMQWMRAGQPLSSLIAEAYEKQLEKEKAAASAESQAAPEEEPEAQDAVETMNSTLDDLEKLFGFGDDAPASEEAAEAPEEQEEEPFDPLVEEDTQLTPLLFHYQDEDYLNIGSAHFVIGYCPFCGSKLSEVNLPD